MATLMDLLFQRQTWMCCCWCQGCVGESSSWQCNRTGPLLPCSHATVRFTDNVQMCACNSHWKAFWFAKKIDFEGPTGLMGLYWVLMNKVKCYCIHNFLYLWKSMKAMTSLFKEVDHCEEKKFDLFLFSSFKRTYCYISFFIVYSMMQVWLVVGKLMTVTCSSVIFD